MYRESPKGSIDNISKYSLNYKVKLTGYPGTGTLVVQSGAPSPSTFLGAFSTATNKAIQLSNLPTKTTFEINGKIQTDMRRGNSGTANWEESDEATATSATTSYYQNQGAAAREITVKKPLMWVNTYTTQGNSTKFSLPVWAPCSASDLATADAQITNFATDFANIPKVSTYVLESNIYQKWVPKWKIKSVNASSSTILNIDHTHSNHALFDDGDIIAAFDGSTYECLDIKVWNTDINASIVLKLAKLSGGYGMRPSVKPYFQLYRHSLNRIFDIQVSYAVKNGTTSNIYQIPGGALEATYENVRFKFCKTQVRIYKNGVKSNEYNITYDANINGQFENTSNVGANFSVITSPFTDPAGANVILTHKSILNGSAYSATTFYESDPWEAPPPAPPP